MATASGTLVSWLSDQLQSGGWVPMVLDISERNGLVLLTLSFYVLAQLLASYNPMEAQRRGFWVVLQNSPFPLKAFLFGRLHMQNMGKLYFWQLFANSVDGWSTWHDDNDFYTREGSPFALWHITRHCFPYGWGFNDRSSDAPESRPVALNSDRLKVEPVYRGRAVDTVDKAMEKISFEVSFEFLTTCATEDNQDIEHVGSGSSNPSEPTNRDQAGERRICVQNEFRITVQPASVDAILASWSDAVLNASIILGLWITLASIRLGIVSLILGVSVIIIGLFLKHMISSISLSQDDVDICTVIIEVGKTIMLDRRLDFNGAGLLTLKVKNLGQVDSVRNTIVVSSRPDTPTYETPGYRSREPENVNNSVSSSPISTVPSPHPDSTNARSDGIRKEVLVQWRKPLRYPHIPWFEAFLGPLIPNSSILGPLYSILMVLSGTVSPSPRNTPRLWFILGSLSILATILQRASGDLRQPFVVQAAIGLITGGVCTRGLAAGARAIIPSVSYAYFDQLAGSMISVGTWILAATI